MARQDHPESVYGHSAMTEPMLQVAAGNASLGVAEADASINVCVEDDVGEENPRRDLQAGVAQRVVQRRRWRYILATISVICFTAIVCLVLFAIWPLTTVKGDNRLGENGSLWLTKNLLPSLTTPQRNPILNHSLQ